MQLQAKPIKFEEKPSALAKTLIILCISVEVDGSEMQGGCPNVIGWIKGRRGSIRVLGRLCQYLCFLLKQHRDAFPVVEIQQQIIRI